MILSVNNVFNKLSNEIVEEIIYRDAFMNYIEDKVRIIQESSRYSIQSSEESEKK